MIWELSVSLFQCCIYLEFLVTVHWCIVCALIAVVVVSNSTRWSWRPSLDAGSGVRVVHHTVRTTLQWKVQQKEDGENIDIEIMVIIRFGHVVKLRKLSICSSDVGHNSHFYLGFHLYEELIFNSIEIEIKTKKTHNSYEYHTYNMQTKWDFHPNIQQNLQFNFNFSAH